MADLLRWPAAGESAGRPAVVERVVRALRAGTLVVGPSDTVYGLLALPSSQAATDRLERVKGRRDRFIRLAESLESVLALAAPAPEHRSALAAIWPGPVTVVLPATPSCSQATVAVRVPAAPFLRDVLRRTGEALYSTSANPPGEPVPGRVEDVAASLREAAAVIVDAGPSSSTEASTVVDLTGPRPRVLRVGAGDPGPLLDRIPHTS